MKPPLITILGPTASGKSTLGIELAQKYNGEIVSCDSRQVFKGLDIGTGKVTKEEQALVPHHLLDIVAPEDTFSVSHFQKLAFEAIDDILSRGKTPFLVGGTALYAYAVIDNYQFSDFVPNEKRRKELESKDVAALLVIASEAVEAQAENADRSNPINPQNNKTQYEKPQHIDQIASVTLKSLRSLGFPRNDIHNPRRLIRAIEKIESNQPLTQQKGPEKYTNTILAIDMPREKLYARIDQRVDDRVAEGMIQEVEQLRKKGVSDAWLLNLGLEYRFITAYLKGDWDTQNEMLGRLKTAIHAFARRQMTWLNKDKRIEWIQNTEQAVKIIKKKSQIR